jgi:predicted NAD/FAD-dependent oxidoreductase
MNRATLPAKPTAAVIGAGLAGAACAERLTKAGWRVTVFDKSRGAGGRAGTRRCGAVIADHGAQFFSVRTAAFRTVVDRWLRSEIAAPWHGRIVSFGGLGEHSPSDDETKYVGIPGMSALARSLLAGARFEASTSVASVRLEPAGWAVLDTRGRVWGPFDAALVAVPPRQAVEIAAGQTPLIDEIRNVAMAPSWAAIAAFEPKLELPWDAAHIAASPLTWVARNGSKPGRTDSPDVWTLHAAPEWSAAHIDEPAPTAARRLLAAFADFAPTRGVTLLHLTGHRWRYARPIERREPRALFDRTRRIGFCGDWTGHARLESAVLSGIALARAASASPLSVTEARA